MKNFNLKSIIALSTTLISVSTTSAQYASKINQQILLTDTVIEKVVNVKQPLQMIEVGVKYMPTFSALDLSTSNGQVVKGSATVSHGFGFGLGINFTRHLGVQGEINYYKSTQIYKDNSVNREVSVSYVNIPVMLSLNTDKTKWVNLNFVAGPQFGMNVSSNLKNTGTPSDTLNAFVSVKKQDVGFAYGAGVELILNRIHTLRLDLGYRGFYGLVNMNDANSTPGNYNVIVKTSRKTYGAYVGLTFLF
jgi:opacity protein-like surface antigen